MSALKRKEKDRISKIKNMEANIEKSKKDLDKHLEVKLERLDDVTADQVSFAFV
jgi:hypothetical protein